MHLQGVHTHKQLKDVAAYVKKELDKKHLLPVGNTGVFHCICGQSFASEAQPPSSPSSRLPLNILQLECELITAFTISHTRLGACSHSTGHQDPSAECKGILTSFQPQ